jgi:biotin transport system substrate-specific component
MSLCPAAISFQNRLPLAIEAHIPKTQAGNTANPWRANWRMKMAIATTTARPLVSLALPEKGAARLATQFGIALLGTLALTLSAKTKVVFGPVDMSLQTLVVMLIAVSFGMRLGIATILLYLAEGAMGLPVFQGTPEKGIGLVYMLGSTGGYLAGFVVMATIVGWAADRGFDRNPFKLFGAMMVAETVMMAMGYAWLATLIGADKAWQFGVVPFIVPDLIKVALASALVPAVWSLLPGKR